MKNSTINKLLRYAVITGNAVFILWITYNGIDEGFSGTMVQKVSYVGLLILLILNIILVYRG